MLTPLAEFSIAYVAAGLVWAGLAVVGFWIWQRLRGTWPLLLTIGAGALAAYDLMSTLGIWFDGIRWFLFLGTVLVALAFYLANKPLIDAKVAAIKAKRGTPQMPPPPQV
jgi:hypothetical protein